MGVRRRGWVLGVEEERVGVRRRGWVLGGEGGC